MPPYVLEKKPKITDCARPVFTSDKCIWCCIVPQLLFAFAPVVMEIRVARRVGDKSWRGKPIEDRLTLVQRQCARTSIGYETELKIGLVRAERHRASWFKSLHEFPLD